MTGRSGGQPLRSTKTVYLIRHGQSEFNRWRIRTVMTCTCCCYRDTNFAQWLRDAPLSPKGHDQVRKLRAQVQKMRLPAETQLIVTSPLTRYTRLLC